MTTRREFIKQSALITAGALITPKNFGLNFLSKPKVIVIGAGFAGLCAAKKLKENGADVTILEATNRTGGRVFSYEMEKGSDLIIELGAEWIGNSHDRILALCSEYNIELLDNTFNDRLIYENKFHERKDWSFSPEWQEKFDRILKDYDSFTLEDKKELDKMDWWRFLMNNDIPQKDLDIREYSDSTDFGESIRFVSAYAALAEYAESGPTNEMDKKMKGGNNMLTNAIAATVGADNIKLNHKVTSIEQSGNVKVRCSNGQTFECDKLICTIPTYSMSKISWSPVLPKDKLDCINSLQYARINKSATLFGERFWKDEAFSILTDTFSHYFYHATKYQNTPKGVLISYSVGDKADIMSRLDKEVRKDALNDSLRVAFGDVLHLMEDNINYYWGTNEYSKGAYALYGSGQWYSVMPVLKEKFNNVYFAGEHVAEWQGFMEGAIQTGEEAAEMILS